MPSTNVWKRQKEEGKIMKDNWDEQISEDQSDGMPRCCYLRVILQLEEFCCPFL